MTTIVDVAKSAGVSIATVSNFINGTKPVSAEKKRRIEDSIEKLHFMPNLSARNLKHKVVQDIGIILPNINDPYYILVLQGIEGHCRQRGLYANITVSHEIPDLESNIIRNFVNKRLAGMILVSCQPDNTSFYDLYIKRNQIPFVHIDRRINGLDASFISTDHKQSMESLTRLYLDKGYRSIFLLTGPQTYSSEADALEGYVSAHKKLGLAVNLNHVWQSVLNKETAFKAVLFALQIEKPEVILTTSGKSAEGALACLRYIGYDVPQDVIVASFGEETWDQQTASDAIFRTSRPSIILGNQAAELLSRQIQTPLNSESQTICLHDGFRERLKSHEGLSLPKTSSAKSKKPRTDRVENPNVLNLLLVDATITNPLSGLIPHFTKNTGIRLNIRRVPSHLYLDALLNEQHEDNVSDIYTVDMPWFATLAENKILADLTDTIYTPDFTPNSFLPACSHHLSIYRGRYYGLPFASSPQILFYRKDLFENKDLSRLFETQYKQRLRPPRTWTEFNAIARFFTKAFNPVSPIKYGASVSGSDHNTWFPDFITRLWAYGGTICDNQCNVSFNSPQTLKAHHMLTETITCCPPDWAHKDYFDAINDFINGDASMLITFQSLLANAADLRKMCLSHNIGYAHVPARCPVLGGWSMCIAEKSQKKELASQFIRWACGDSIANFMALMTGQSAIERVYRNDELVDLYPWLPLVHDIHDDAKAITPPFGPEGKTVPYEEIKKIVYEGFISISTGQMSARESIGLTHDTLRLLFERYGYPQRAL